MADKIIDSVIKVTSRYTDSEKARTNPDKYAQIRDSNIARIEKWINEKDIAVLTAFRGFLDNVTNPGKTLLDKPIDGTEEERKYAKAENRARNRDLKAALLSYGYGVTAVTGVYPEELPNGQSIPKGEESLMVVNLPNDPNFQSNIAQLSEWFNQDSYLYKPKGSEQASLIGTNSAWPGYGESFAAGKFMKAVQGPFITKLKNKGFAFTNDPQDYADKHTEGDPATWKDRKDQRVFHKVDDDYIMDSLVEQRVNSWHFGKCVSDMVSEARKVGKLPR